MSEIMEYKCPACGGAMEFDSQIQKMKCPYCDTVMEVAEYQNMQQAQESTVTDNSGNVAWKSVGNEQWEAGETDGMRVYSCESCGGEIIADETTGASTCPYCGNRIVMKGQFAGDLRPDAVLPFKLDKEAAKKAYQKFITGRKFLPKVFSKENHIDEIKGVYVPFWLFNADVNADILYDAEEIRRWESGNIEYTERSHYEVRRGGMISFANIPADGSKKMDDALMESIEPFHINEAVPFNPAYLAGYMADRYDVTVEESIARAEKRLRQSTEDAFRSGLQSYEVINTSWSRINISRAGYRYVLYPVWLLNTTWNGKKYTFAMNGQTGKMTGDLPQDDNAIWKSIGIKSVIIAAVLYALNWLIVLM